MLEGSIQQELDLSEQVLRRWMMGDEEAISLDQIPLSFHQLIENREPREQRLALLACISQQQTFLMQPKTPSLTALDNLPKLGLETLRETLRPLFRRIIDQMPDLFIGQLLALMLQRGVIAHPADWLPQQSDENLPKMYWPWCRWVADFRSKTKIDAAEKLDQSNWDEFFPAERLALLREMRTSRPSEAREIIEQCAQQEAADKRCKIINTLAINLSTADAEFLKSLLEDRSKKISLLAGQMLTRLNLVTTISADSSEPIESVANELAETLDVNRSGLIKKRLTITPKKLKSKKQEAIRSEQLEQVPFQFLANALKLKGEQLAEAWQYTDFSLHDNQRFVTSAANTMQDAFLDLYIDNMVNKIGESEMLISLLQPLLARLSGEQKATLFQTVLNKHTVKFFDCLSLSDGSEAQLDWKSLQRTPTWKDLVNKIKSHISKQSYMDDSHLNRELNSLGLFLPQDTAAQVLDFLVEQGLLRADPALDTLKLNSQLTKF